MEKEKAFPIYNQYIHFYKKITNISKTRTGQHEQKTRNKY